MIHSCDEKVVFIEGVFGTASTDHVSGEQIKPELELVTQFVLPLFRKATWGNDQAAAKISSYHQFFDQQTRHDCLACPWVVGQKKAERQTMQHRFVDRADLMG